jgi:hypothetical protein
MTFCPGIDILISFLSTYPARRPIMENKYQAGRILGAA